MHIFDCFSSIAHRHTRFNRHTKLFNTNKIRINDLKFIHFPNKHVDQPLRLIQEQILINVKTHNKMQLFILI